MSTDNGTPPMLPDPYVMVLADAIDATGLTDKQLAAITFGECDAELIARLRAKQSVIPMWHEITALLRYCHLTPSDIGQPTFADGIRK